ncbi:unnamed protein product [Boreogadus saida]
MVENLIFSTIPPTLPRLLPGTLLLEGVSGVVEEVPGVEEHEGENMEDLDIIRHDIQPGRMQSGLQPGRQPGREAGYKRWQTGSTPSKKRPRPPQPLVSSVTEDSDLYKRSYNKKSKNWTRHDGGAAAKTRGYTCSGVDFDGTLRSPNSCLPDYPPAIALLSHYRTPACLTTRLPSPQLARYRTPACLTLLPVPDPRLSDSPAGS